MMFSAWKKEDRDAAVIKVQKQTICILLGFCLLLSIGWMSAPSRLRIYIPPDISNGATVKANEIPNALIYSFTYELWQELNYWPEDGTKNYPKNLHVYAAYVLPAFQTELHQEYNELMGTGQVQRQRYVQGISGAAFDSSSVKKLNANAWQVNLRVRLMEYKNNELVKDIEVLYSLKVVRHDVSNSNNPYGLALAGFISSPVRLKTYV